MWDHVRSIFLRLLYWEYLEVNPCKSHAVYAKAGGGYSPLDDCSPGTQAEGKRSCFNAAGAPGNSHRRPFSIWSFKNLSVCRIRRGRWSQIALFEGSIFSRLPAGLTRHGEFDEKWNWNYQRHVDTADTPWHVQVHCMYFGWLACEKNTCYNFCTFVTIWMRTNDRGT